MRATSLNLNCISAIASWLALACSLDLERLCALKFMVLRLHRFILVNLVGICILPRVLMLVCDIAWEMQTIILIET